MKVARTARQPWRAWYDWVRNWSDQTFYLAVLIGILSIITPAAIHADLLMEDNFKTVACDTAAFQNAIVNTLYGHPFRDTAYDGPNILGLHTLFIILLIAPFYAIFPYTNLLFAFQVIVVYSVFIPIYLIGVKRTLKPVHAFILTCSLLTNTILLGMATAPLHAETGILACVLWSYYGYLNRNVTRCVMPMLLAFICGEQSALIFVSMGLFIYLSDKDKASRIFSSSMVGGGLIWLVVALGIIIPLSRAPDQTNLFALNYGNWNVTSAKDLLYAIITNPFEAASNLLDPYKWGYVLALAGLPLLLLLRDWRSCLLILPFPVFLLMTDEQFYLDIHYYYFQFVLFAGIIALTHFFKEVYMASRWGIVVITGTFLSNLVVAALYFSFISYSFYFRNPLNDALLSRFAEIPVYDGVLCQHRYSAFLSNRPDMVMGDLTEKNVDIDALIERNGRLASVHANQINYIVCDLLTGQPGLRMGIDDQTSSDNRMDNMNAYIRSGHWRAVWNQEDVYILQRVR